MEILHSGLLLDDFGFLALSYHTFDEHYKKIHLIVTEKSAHVHGSLQNYEVLQSDLVCIKVMCSFLLNH